MIDDRVVMTKTPLRVSFVGGGTDMPYFYNEYGGSTISCAINRYIYVTAKHHNNYQEKYRLNYSQTENVSKLTDIKNLRIKNISAKSPEYIYRLYFEAWKKKVERMGSMNYPEAAKINNSFSNLVMKVTINSNGLVHNIAIIKSSGNEDLDIAAADIVKNGSPYAPFSEQMKREVDQVNITRIWKFIEDQNFSTAQ